MFKKHKIFMLTMLTMIVLPMAACGSPEQKKLKFYNKGLALYDKGDYTKARLEFSNAAKIDFKYADAQYMLGMTALRSGDPDMAYRKFSKVIEFSSQHTGANVQLGWFLLSAGQQDKAMNKADMVLKQDTKNEEALMLKGAVLAKKKGADSALKFMASFIGKEIRKADGYIFLTALYKEKGDMHSVEKTLRAGIRANDKSIPLYIALADFLISQKRIDESIDIMQKVIALKPDETKHQMVLAGIYMDAGNEKKTADILKTFISAKPEDETRWIEAANFYVLKNRPAIAEQQLKEGMRQNAKSFLIRFALSALYLGSNRPDQAVRILQANLEISGDAANPDIIHTKNTLAQFYIAHHKLDKAEKYVNEVIKERPGNVDANFIKGTIQLKKNNGRSAVAFFRTVVNEKPEFIQAYVNLADAHLLNKEINLALATLKETLEIEPYSRNVIRAMGRIYALQRDFKRAELQYRKVLKVDPKDIEILADLGDLFLLKGDFKKAKPEYARIKQLDHGLPLGYLKLSAMYGTQKKWNKAIDELEQLVKIHPAQWSATNDLAYLLSEHGNGKKDLDRALVLALKSNKFNQNNPNIVDTLGWIYYRRGEISQAIDFLTRALAKNTKNPVFNYHLGMAYYKAGNKAQAKRYIKTSLDSELIFPGKEKAGTIMAMMK